MASSTQGATDGEGATYQAVLKSKSSCEFELVARWPESAQVATVIGQWYFNGIPPAPGGSFVFTTEAPDTGPNRGTIRGHAAFFTAGPLYRSSAAYPWYVLVQYYDQAGSQLGSVYSNVEITECAAQPGL